MFNSVCVGRLGADPELKTVGETSLASFSLAVDSGYDRESGKRLTSWVNCSVWGKRADTVAKYISKGDQITVSGDMHNREYERKDGGKGYALDLKVADFTLPAKPKAEDEAI